MFGSFTEETLSKYAELARKKFKGHQGSEWMDNVGVDPASGKLKEEPSSNHDFAECVRVRQ